MGIVKTDQKTEEYIKSFMDKNGESGNGPAISNYQLKCAVDLYSEMLESENSSVCQFASNAGGFSTYHYYKKKGDFYGYSINRWCRVLNFSWNFISFDQKNR